MALTDPNLGLNYGWEFRESGWKNGMDANLKKLGALVQLAVTSKTAPVPAGPTNGDRYIVPAGATGAWAGQVGKIAVRIAGVWEFHTPGEGWLAWVTEDRELDVFTGGAWETLLALP